MSAGGNAQPEAITDTVQCRATAHDLPPERGAYCTVSVSKVTEPFNTLFLVSRSQQYVAYAVLGKRFEAIYKSLCLLEKLVFAV